MSVQTKHVPIDRLTALAFAARAPETDSDQHALLHISHCDRCANELARLTTQADTLRAAAFAQADALFDDAALETQRTRILDKLANLGQVARVLRFPLRTRAATMPVSGASRRWVSVAAAAGLIIGLVAGQLIHFVPWGAPARRDSLALQPQTRQSAGTTVVLTGSAISDDQFLDEVEATVQLRRTHSLRTLDALTPTAGDFRGQR